MVTGPLFHWSDTWQLIINTVTNIVSMLMVFLIQNTQNRDDAAWIGVNVQEPLWNDRVTKAIDNQLTAKGWRKVDSGGDASISAVGATHTEQTVETLNSGGSVEAGVTGLDCGPGFATTTVEPTPVGTLHIHIFDSQSKKVIWHGVCTDTLTGNPEKNEKRFSGNSRLLRKARFL